MNFLEEKIITDGKIFDENIIKVDGFLNHQIDMDTLRQVACEFKRRFKGVHVDKILTIEASGIAVAVMLANMYDVPVVFAKKNATVNSTDDKYMSEAFSFTHKKMNNVFVSKPYLKEGENILIIDDFLADGQAASALIDIVNQAKANVVGIGVAIEKGQQNGGKMLREKGFHVESIAIIDSMNTETQTVFFRRQ